MRRWGEAASPRLAVSPFETTRMSDRFEATIAQLWVYPIKSCAGVSLTQAELTDDGLLFDRSWMVVDAHGDFVSQRECPRMALIQPTLTPTRQLLVSAPGMRDLSVDETSVAQPLRVRVWDDEVAALDMGESASSWFTQCLNPEGDPALGRLRLVRFDPQGRRVSDRRWTGEREATTQFADGFAVLVTSEASLDGLNTRLTQAGHASVDQRRFRPNIVLAGVAAHDEDRVCALTVDTGAGGATLEAVKPCGRCPIPNIDPDTALSSSAVGDTLQTYRVDLQQKGAITFGMNAVVRAGAGEVLRVGQGVQGDWRFD
jgi:uncharacterized protein YcbX